jgi:hypothetical protein
MIEMFAKKNFNYEMMCKFIDLTAKKIKSMRGKLNKTKFSKFESEIFVLFKRISLNEKEEIKTKLKKFYYKI